jgi:hypothetical protein
LTGLQKTLSHTLTTYIKRNRKDVRDIVFTAEPTGEENASPNSSTAFLTPLKTAPKSGGSTFKFATHLSVVRIYWVLEF